MSSMHRAGVRLAGAIVIASCLVAFGCAPARAIKLQRSADTLTVHKPALYPETIEYNKKTDRFLVSSFREGAVYEVDGKGDVSRLVDDERLCSVLGIALDVERDRLWAVNANLGASTKACSEGPKKLAAVGIYRLSTGKVIDYVDLAPLSQTPHLLNGIAVDSAGNAYITDSFSPIIYKVDAHGKATVFLKDERFLGEGVNLNGVVVHPDGYLLVVKKSDGALFRVPLASPSNFARVDIADRFVGGDGLTLVGKRELVVIANETPGVASNVAFSLSSEDGWISAKLYAVQRLGTEYPTTGVVRDGNIYVVQSKLNELIQASPDQKVQLRQEAIIRRIGTVGTVDR
jgi:hypothetical protein